MSRTTTPGLPTESARTSRFGIALVDVAILMVPTALGVLALIPHMKAVQRAQETGVFVPAWSIPPAVTVTFYAGCCLLALAAVVSLCWWTFTDRDTSSTTD